MTTISTINSYVTHGITVGAGQYAATLTIENTGGGVKTTIAGQTAIVLDIAGTNLINNGRISGGPPGSGSITGIGVLISANATVSNTGIILGGYTLTDGVTADGGAGVAMTGGTLLNAGMVYGGTCLYGGGIRGDAVDAAGKVFILNERAGVITGAADHKDGSPGIGVSLSGGATLVNDGNINGGLGNTVGNTDGTIIAYGGAAGIIAAGTGGIVNNFHVYGGVGGNNYVYHSAGQSGGAGIDILGVNTVTNTYAIIGGRGGYGGDGGFDQPSANPGKQGGMGGAGLNLASTGLVTNSGTVAGGLGGTGGDGGSNNAYVFANGGAGGTGGFGVEIGLHGQMVNTGTLAGGSGGLGGRGSEQYGGLAGTGGTGGDGVFLDGGTLKNAGTIEAGAGGYGGANGGSYASSPHGTTGLAVAFGSLAGTLVVEKGAVFIGDVIAAKGVADVLELSGKSTATLSGFGTQLQNFKHISFASGAAWEIAGNAAGLTTGEKITGFTASDKIKILNTAGANGTVSVETAGVVTIESGGKTYTLDITGAVKGETDFKFSAHTLTKTAKPEMTFIAPPAAPASAAAPATGPWDPHCVPVTPMPIAPAPSAAAAPYGGLVYALTVIPTTSLVVPLKTLHAEDFR